MAKFSNVVCITFCMKLSKSAIEMLCDAFGEHSLSRTAVFEWHSCFKADRVSAEDDECSGQPSNSRPIENVENI
jgi:hypothetical protein